MPCIVLDVPHQWTGWTKRLLIGADDILVVAAPDLANLRNAKNMVDLLRGCAAQRSPPASTASTRSACPKRPEIKPADFAKALEDEPLAIIPFEPQLFGTAANNGQMIAEIASSHKRRRDLPPAGADPDRPQRPKAAARQPASAVPRQAAEATALAR